ncbi:SUF system Fe-S cluster assembly regulator [Methylocucumis oryzae]|uniref:Rrf2 family transcriptional regulator n=1 Tax=Methylocucumis oryzae TaxID=1632867 RepID=A0A0F3IK87_9GAMM|nr:SUF system Fe-S cluster assembly regulator [Methylocucumis oryzae]KJV05999.1 Rrf2 family transcriptional regulator [Methylocucumis oryzae]
MLKLSKFTDYATVILSLMAKQPSRLRTAIEIAEATHIALPTVSKILKLLTQAQVVMSIRGAKGGYLLARAPEQISIAAIISALEGPIALTECSLSKHSCEQASGCGIRANWHKINQTIHHALESVSLADLALPEEILIPVSSLTR